MSDQPHAPQRPLGRLHCRHVIWPTSANEVVNQPPCPSRSRPGPPVRLTGPRGRSNAFTCGEFPEQRQPHSGSPAASRPTRHESPTADAAGSDAPGDAALGSGANDLACTISFTLELDSPELLATMSRYVSPPMATRPTSVWRRRNGRRRKSEHPPEPRRASPTPATMPDCWRTANREWTRTTPTHRYSPTLRPGVCTHDVRASHRCGRTPCRGPRHNVPRAYQRLRTPLKQHRRARRRQPARAPLPCRFRWPGRGCATGLQVCHAAGSHQLRNREHRHRHLPNWQQRHPAGVDQRHGPRRQGARDHGRLQLEPSEVQREFSSSMRSAVAAAGLPSAPSPSTGRATTSTSLTRSPW